MTGNKKDVWYFVIIQNPETSSEQFVGYTDQTKKTDFIPAFHTKDIAQQCFLVMPKDIMNEKYEVQAIIKEDLMEHARKNNFEVFILDDKGNKLGKLS